ncbi:uncharacterized protein LOC113459057 isoform X1 [Zonotrichia albicollis]|uniref:uncharacterized protein LOC113459057 isoform X1 n=1 Tax=Zonotrichia albicollis TaxID=44394 RepID=UPI003D80BBD3
MESVLQTLHQLHCSLDIFRNGDEAKEPRKPSSLLKHCKRVLRKPKGEKVCQPGKRVEKKIIGKSSQFPWHCSAFCQVAAIISVVAEIILGQHSPSLNTHGHSDEGGEDGLQGREYFLSLNTHGHSDGGDGDGLQRSPMALGRLAMFVFSLGFRNLRGRFTWMMGPPLKLHPLSQWCFLPFWSRHPSSSCRRALHRTEGGDGLWRVATAKGH